MFAVAIVPIKPGLVTVVIGLGVLGSVIAGQWLTGRRATAAGAQGD